MTENLRNLAKNHRLIIAIAITLVLIIALPSIASISGLNTLSSIGFNQGTQGLGWQFNSIYWNGWWNSQTRGSIPNLNYITGQAPISTQQQIANDFGGSLNFAPDQSGTSSGGANGGVGFPTLGGTFGAMNADVQNASGKNQIYTWNIQNGTIQQNGQTMNVVNQFQMQRVQCTMSFNVFLSGTGSEAGPSVALGAGQAIPNYAGAQIWMKITPQQFLYFSDNPNQFYIAPALIQLTSNAEPALASVGGGISGMSDTQRNQFLNQQSTNPEAQGDTFYIYYAPTNTPSQSQISDNQVLSMVNGQQLDPSIFRNSYYVCLNLHEFLPWNDWGFLGVQYHHYAFPSMNYKLTMYVWVVGEWTTYFKPGETIVQKPHPVVSGGQDYFSWLGDLLNPFGNMSWLVWVMVVAVALVILYYYLFKRKPNDEGSKQSKLKNKYFGLSLFDWTIVGLFGGLTFIPDPTDILTGGLPFADPIIAIVYYYWRSRKNKIS